MISFREFMIQEKIEMVDNGYDDMIRVTIDPTVEQLKTLIKNNDPPELRYILNDGKLYVWDSEAMIHSSMASNLGIETGGFWGDTVEAFTGYFNHYPEASKYHKPGFYQNGEWDNEDGRLSKYREPFNIKDDADPRYENPADIARDKVRDKALAHKLARELTVHVKAHSRDDHPVHAHTRSRPIREAREQVYRHTSFREFITEKRETVNGHTVYFNPTINDLRMLGYEARCFIDDESNLYLWDAYDLTHYDVMKYYGYPLTADGYAGAGMAFGMLKQHEMTRRLAKVRMDNKRKKRLNK